MRRIKINVKISVAHDARYPSVGGFFDEHQKEFALKHKRYVDASKMKTRFAAKHILSTMDIFLLLTSGHQVFMSDV